MFVGLYPLPPACVLVPIACEYLAMALLLSSSLKIIPPSWVGLPI
jgi:hypothetical protein